MERRVLFDVAEGLVGQSNIHSLPNQKPHKIVQDLVAHEQSRWVGRGGWSFVQSGGATWDEEKPCDDWGKDVSQVESRWCDSQVVDYETFLWMHHTVLHLKKLIKIVYLRINLNAILQTNLSVPG